MSRSSSIETLFFAALDREDPQERAAYLAAACSGDVELRRVVERMLDAHPKARGFLESPASAEAIATAVEPSVPPGTLVGPYELLRQIGEGGMGTVFLAEQTHPVRRKVALKLIKPGMDSRQVVARFEAERQALALMDHANIARVLDAGTTGDATTGAARPYFVMELVVGVPITQYCDEHHLTPRERLELFVPVCRAIQHAHQKGIIHRDVKPSNVLVTVQDGAPVPKVIDFGVAKATEPDPAERTRFTQHGALVGTLEYMSPEQAEPSALGVDTRTDVYSLGALLYELLTGSTPLDNERVRQVANAEVLRMLKEEDPPKPSTRLSDSGEALASISARRRTEPAKLASLVRGDLDWIVMKTLEKDRNRRYDTASGLAQDLERYLADEPVSAGPPSRAYRLRKFVRRNRLAVSAGAAVLLALIAGVAGTAYGLVRAERERVKAEEAEAATLADYRASTDDAIEHLIGSKAELGPRERAYLERTLERWKSFAARRGDDETSRAIRAEGHLRVAALWQRLERVEEARAACETARELLGRLVVEHPDTPRYRQALARAHDSLGQLHRSVGAHDEARARNEAARDLRKGLADEFPGVPEYRHDLARSHADLGCVLDELGQRDAARAEFETARDLFAALAQAFPAAPQHRDELARTRHNLAVLLNRQGRSDEARAEFGAAIDLQQALAAAYPAVPAYRQALGQTRHNLGVLLAAVAARDEARVEFEAARDLRRELADALPGFPRYPGDLAHTHNSLGLLLKDLGELEAAAAEYAQARALQEELVADFPGVPFHREELAITLNNEGVLLHARGRLDAACAVLSAAIELYRKLRAEFPAVPDYAAQMGGSSCNLGNAMRDGGRLEESLSAYDDAIRALTAAHELDPRVVVPREHLRNSHVGRARACDRLGRSAEAVRDFDRAIELTAVSDRAPYRAERVASLARAGRASEAVAEIEALIDAKDWPADRWLDFACVYAVASGAVPGRESEHADRAMELLLRALDVGCRDVARISGDPALDALRGRDDFRRAIAELSAEEE